MTLPWDLMTAVTASDKPGAAATNQSPPNPSRYNESRPAGSWRSVCGSVSVYVCVLLAAQRDGGGENTQEIRDLLITLCSVSPALPLPLSIFPGLPFSASLFIEGCRGQCFRLCNVLQTSVTLLLLKHHFRGLSRAQTWASV